jgi:hypothetical protein
MEALKNNTTVFAKPDNLEKFADNDSLFKKYEELATEATSIVICNY